MDRNRFEMMKKYATAAAFVLIALWVAWQGRVFNQEGMGLITPIMCALVGLTFSFTGYAIVSRSEE